VKNRLKIKLEVLDTIIGFLTHGYRRASSTKSLHPLHRIIEMGGKPDSLEPKFAPPAFRQPANDICIRKVVIGGHGDTNDSVDKIGIL
jgi:hypothetical protein